MLAWARRNWKWIVPASVAGVAAAAWVLFGWFGVHTLFFDQTVGEAAPTFTAAPATTSTAAPATSTTPAATTPESPGQGSEVVPTSEPEPATTTSNAPPQPIVVAEGSFIDRSHPTSGAAIVLGDGGDQRVLRLEGFRTDNGPDLFVYLSAAAPDAPAEAFDDDFVDLGVLKGNVGDQNYEIPAGVDLDRYTTVVVWCRRFAVAFGAAGLNG